MQDVAAIILGAGKSTRMQSDQPKVLHPVGGRPMLACVLDACRQAGIDSIRVVVGHHKDRVIKTFGHEERIEWIDQPEQLGTGHAVMMCEESFSGFDGDIVVIAGDMPLIRPQTLRRLVEIHRSARAAVSLATARLDDPTGYGRIIRNESNGLARIVEHNDCDPRQKEITEVNISYYCFDCRALFNALRRVKPDNAKGEHYITDVVHVLVAGGCKTAILPDVPPEDALGVNSPEELAEVERLMRQRADNLQPS